MTQFEKYFGFANKCAKTAHQITGCLLDCFPLLLVSVVASVAPHFSSWLVPFKKFSPNRIAERCLASYLSFLSSGSLLCCIHLHGAMHVPADDPFPLVQREVSSAWASLSQTLSTLPDDDRAARLKSLSDDVQDLADAVQIARQDRLRFNLSEEELASRDRFVRDMQSNLALARSSTARSSLTAKASNSSTTQLFPESGAVNDGFMGDEMAHQQQILQQQDEQLDHLADAVQRIGNIGRDMHLELEEQGQLLDNLGSEMEDTASRMKRVRQRLDRFIEETGPRQFCTIVWLSVTFLVLTMLVVIT